MWYAHGWKKPPVKEDIVDIEINDIVAEEYEMDPEDPGLLASVRTDCPDGQSPQIEAILWDNKLLREADSDLAGDWKPGEPRFVATLDGEGQEFTAEQCRQWSAVLLKAADLLDEYAAKATL